MVKKQSILSKKSKRRFKIVSKTRFCIFLAFIWLLACPAILLAMDYTKTQDSRSYIKVCVEKGDTLWDIAKRSLPKNTDIRDYIQEIKAVNQLETSFIKEGEVLEIPVHP